MSYESDKRIFLKQYGERLPHAPLERALEGWKARYIAYRVANLGESPEQAESDYNSHEGKEFLPNPRRKSLPGGAPHEFVLEVAIYAKAAGGVFVGALLENKSEVRFVEVTGSDMPKLYRLSPGSATLAEILYRTGQRRSLPPGFTELDTLVRVVSDDPKAFAERAEKDPEVEWLEAHPRAAVLARWGSRGERAVAHL